VGKAVRVMMDWLDLFQCLNYGYGKRYWFGTGVCAPHISLFLSHHEGWVVGGGIGLLFVK